MSVENFYWLLTEILLKPSRLDCWYFHPFGTRDHISCAEFRPPVHPLEEHHALFQFDQEPIWEINDVYSKFPHQFGLGGFVTSSVKLCRLLANSEHSLIKHQACEKYNMLDWYFFYHGFAALDWFRDSKFIDHLQSISKVYCSYNHLVQHKRSYRIALTAKLIEADVGKFGDLSFHGTADQVQNELNSLGTCLTGTQKQTITKYLSRTLLESLKVDAQTIDGNYSAHFGHHEYKLWQRSFLHVVNETVFYDDKLHLTEKVFKPIVALRPFILAAAPGNLSYLQHYGFKTFSSWIDESYDLVTNPELRLDMIVAEIIKLCSLSISDLQQMHLEMMPILNYNKKHFFGEFRRIIVEELVNNFDQCLRIWNNGRVDGRDLHICADLDRIKKLLSS